MAAPSYSRSPRTRPVRRQPGNFDLYAWFFMRVSGVFLLLLVFAHVLIMHLLNDITAVNYQFVAIRWETPFWRTYDWLMLILALAHGSLGLRTIIEDYVHTRHWRLIALTLLVSFAVIFVVIGSLVILTFEPVQPS